MINILETWRARRRIRQTQQQLYGLSDQMLFDIGLTRSDIRSVGRNGRTGRHGS